MKQTFYSNGKLFITGEYLVLDGAKAFALPTKFGQDLTVETIPQKILRWKSFDADGSIWFETEISFPSIIHKSSSENPIENTLIEILHTAWQMNPTFLDSEGFSVATHLTFPRNWGLGTSSTLVNNIAQWLSVDAYDLLWKSFGGSGYDIACAQHDSAVIYQIADGKPKVELPDFHPTFAPNLYFVYLNRKQNSKTAIANYKNKRADLGQAIEDANLIAESIVQSKDANAFANHLEHYEKMLAPILEIPTIQQQLFPNFEGTVKSLGAWGGDFVLVVSKDNPSEYFKSKGYETIIRYSQMIL